MEHLALFFTSLSLLFCLATSSPIFVDVTSVSEPDVETKGALLSPVIDFEPSANSVQVLSLLDRSLLGSLQRNKDQVADRSTVFRRTKRNVMNVPGCPEGQVFRKYRCFDEKDEDGEE
ncbi:hypothetical protein B5X24_HaOG215156 [Helicoverpa armigera]|nr:hypothetical protein B5X24_HaOG215156 [Helicoverpa armigera]